MNLIFYKLTHTSLLCVLQYIVLSCFSLVLSCFRSPQTLGTTGFFGSKYNKNGANHNKNGVNHNKNGVNYNKNGPSIITKMGRIITKMGRL